MSGPPLPPNETERLKALYRYRIFNTPPEPQFDDLTHLAARLCHTSMAAIIFVAEDYQWFKSKFGFDATRTPRDVSLCAHGVAAQEPLIISDTTKDPRFANNPLVTEICHIRFYAGIPLITADGFCLGTLSVMDGEPREFAGEQRESLDILAKQVMSQLELRLKVRELEESIAEQRRAEEALTASEAHYRFLFDSNPMPMWVYDAETFQFLAVNEAAIQHYGYSREEFLAMKTVAIWPDHELPEIFRYLEAASENPRNSAIWRHKKKDGTIITVDIVSHRLYFRGRLARLVLANDITSREQALAALQKSEQRFQLVTRATNDAIWDWDLVHHTIWWNDCFRSLFGYEAHEIEHSDESWASRIHPEDQERVVRGLHQRIQSRAESWQDEYRFRRKDGSFAFVFDRGYVLRDADGKAIRMVGGMTDLSEKKKLEAQSFRSQRMESIGTLAGGIAHDLNNVLAPIMMALEIFKVRLTRPEDRDLIATVEESAHRGADMVRQVLSFARGVEGKRVLVQPAHLFREVERITHETFPKTIVMQMVTPPNGWMLLGDPTQLHQVLLNLCVNARDAMPRGGKLTVSNENLLIDENFAKMFPSANTGPHILIKVTDNGIGMPSEIREKIFEPFFTTKEVGQGTGLGLSTTLAIVKSHGGFISVESEVGKGTTFQVYIPARPMEAEAQLAQEQVTLPRGHGEVILVADDEASIRTITRETLESFGYRVLTANDGAEAVAKYALHLDEIAAVLTDMMMPIMDGPATIHALRRLNPAVRIIGASGMAKKPRSNTTPVNRFLSKPYTADTLLNALHDVIHGEAGELVTNLVEGPPPR